MRNLPLVLTTLLYLFFNLTPTAAASAQEAAFLRHVAEQYILAQFEGKNYNFKLEVSAAPIDENRNYGGKCEGFLTAQLQGTDIKTNNQVRIICSHPKHSFNILVPVQVKRLYPILITENGITRGSIVSEDMITQKWQANREAPSGAIYDPSQIIGSTAKRDIQPGSQLLASNFCLVCKGDLVSITASGNGLSLRTTGIAISDGNLGETISVRNTKSNRTIKAQVSALKEVQVHF